MQATINLSEAKYSSTFFANLQSKPGEYFKRLRREYIAKEIKRFDGLESFNTERALMQAADAGSLAVEVSQRRGYKQITFTL